MTVNIAILGFGTVGTGLPTLISENKQKLSKILDEEIVISKVLMRDEKAIEKARAQGYQYDFVLTLEEILADSEISIVVELMGRIEPAKTYITKVIKAGKNVVTANKDLLAVHGTELRALAEKHHVALYYEAAVAGGIPILRTLANSFSSDKITHLLGILNGTSNFMMTKMSEEAWTYDQSLAKAQELGYAESDPTNDVDGIDASYKLAILSEFAFGMTLSPDQISKSGLRTIQKTDVEIAQQFGYILKLTGEINEVESGIFAEVSPTFLPKSHPLASVNGVMNAVFIESEGIGDSMFYGAGAGQKPTATSVLADIVRIVKREKDGTIGKSFNEYARPTSLANPHDIVNKYYFSVETPDSTGQLLRLVELFTSEDVSFEQVLQQKGDGHRAVVVIISHQINRVQLLAIQDKLKEEVDFKLLNYFKVLGD
ncbi:homoserine dehydrogenase [Lactococcus lactis]|uniref:homoserine dehydrogenase n=1 Tax=Lactococcus TaxID=1357 RepID=UPI001CDBD239|nr:MULTISPECIES: homoserine dehydrogenase [Lactococcus]MCA2388963.1 homoserine dehydrogenase [Lactococcus sp. NH2-7C]MCI1071203.1 homoserine dehydrogenase [Lactococcus lactis]MCT1193308.1 homoserine dehydrogenase [Lactococcus lactis]MCT1225982.1 homoserine dehydrogenase [Lactococcus lactis]WGV30516.1 homoserine dehydrogenase [Lactococcus sp. NH2-7C]